MEMHNVIGATAMYARLLGWLCNMNPIPSIIKAISIVFCIFLCGVALSESKQVRVALVGDSHNTGRLSGGYQ